MLATTLSTYGGPYADALPAEDPSTQLAASKANRMMEDVAQMTIPAVRACIKFTTHGTLPVIVDAWSVYGSGLAQQPTPARSAAGVYTFTYAATYTDATGYEETTSFKSAIAALSDATTWGLAKGRKTAANVITVYTGTVAGANDDLGGGVEVTVWIN